MKSYVACKVANFSLYAWKVKASGRTPSDLLLYRCNDPSAHPRTKAGSDSSLMLIQTIAEMGPWYMAIIF